MVSEIPQGVKVAEGEDFQAPGQLALGKKGRSCKGELTRALRGVGSLEVKGRKC